MSNTDDPEKTNGSVKGFQDMNVRFSMSILCCH